MSIEAAIELAARVFPESPTPRIAAGSLKPHIPSADADHDAGPEDWAYSPAEGQTVIIGYRDSAGAESTRRITIWGVRTKGDRSVIMAKCHERGANRAFRADRILFVASLDGEIKPSTQDYLSDLMAVDYSAASNSSKSFKAEIRKVLKSSGVPLLISIARADDEFHPLEESAILDYVMDQCAAAGRNLDAEQRLWLAEHISSLRLTKHVVESSLGQLVAAGPQVVTAFATFANQLLTADHRLRKGEAARFLELTVRLFGLAASRPKLTQP